MRRVRTKQSVDLNRPESTADLDVLPGVGDGLGASSSFQLLHLRIPEFVSIFSRSSFGERAICGLIGFVIVFLRCVYIVAWIYPVFRLFGGVSCLVGGRVGFEWECGLLVCVFVSLGVHFRVGDWRGCEVCPEDFVECRNQ